MGSRPQTTVVRVKKILPLAALLAVLIPATAMAAPKSKFRFSQATYVTSEDAGTATVTITRVARHGHSRINQSSSVNWSITGGSATNGTDYTVAPAQGKLTFSPGQTTADLTFAISQDTDIEPLESVQLKLSAASSNALITNPRTSQLLIADDDGPDQVQLVPAAQNINEAVGTSTFYAVRSGKITTDASVHYATSDGTATAGPSNVLDGTSDYTAESGTLAFHKATTTTPPDYSQTISVPVVDDTAIENSENFNVTLSALTGGPVFPNSTLTATGS